MPWHDHHVIACGWKRVSGGYRVFVKEDPSLSATGSSIEEAGEKLEQLIYDVAPDLDAVHPAVLDYDPPLPAQAELRKFLEPEYYIISGDGVFDPMTSRSEWEPILRRLYTKGICSSCNAGIGKRTENPLLIEFADPVDAGFARCCGNPVPRLYSDRFLKLLTSDELARLSFQPVELKNKRIRRKYFELVSTPEIAQVAAKGFDNGGFQCTECGHRMWYVDEPWINESPGGLWYFACRQDLPSAPPDWFLYGVSGGPELCMSRRRWDQMRSRAGTKGIHAGRLGFVDENEADRHPRLRLQGRKCPTCADWPEPVGVDRNRRVPFDLNDEFWSIENYTWIWPAARSGHIDIVRQTRTLDEMLLMLDRKERPKRPEVISFHCPDCWRLGRIIYTNKELIFNW